jgi:hypothetical protein
VGRVDTRWPGARTQLLAAWLLSEVTELTCGCLFVLHWKIIIHDQCVIFRFSIRQGRTVHIRVRQFKIEG